MRINFMAYKKSISLNQIYFCSVFIFLTVNTFAANSPVKSVDESGHVTYSDKPSANAESVSKVKIQAGPSESEINTAQQQANKNISAAKEIDQKNAAALEKQKANKKAEQSTAKVDPETKYLSAPTNRDKYGNKPPRPTHPIKRPGIDPPPSNFPAARPKARAGGR